MRMLTFDEYWSTNGKPSGLSDAVDAAFREIALQAWNAATNSAAQIAQMSDSEIRLMAGELNKGEMRTTKAVLSGCAARIGHLQEQR